MTCDDAQLRLVLLGQRWRIDLSDYEEPAALRDQLAELWSRALDHDEPDGEEIVIRPQTQLHEMPTRQRPRIRMTDDPRAFPYEFSGALTRAVLHERAGTAVLFHAAGLVAPDAARAVVLVAPSGTGKSTAARVLGRRFGYLSDELVAVETGMRVVAYPKPISFIVPGFPGGKDEKSPDDLELLEPLSTSPELAAVIRLARDPEREGRPEIVRTGIHEALSELILQTSSIWKLPRPLQRLANIAAHGGGPFVLHYSEIVDAASIIDEMLARTDSPPCESNAKWVAHEPAGEQIWLPSGIAESPADATRVVRAPWTDAVESGGEITVLQGPALHRLAGIGASLWRACLQPMGLAELTEIVISEHGAHPDARELVDAATENLVVAGIIVRTV